MPLLDQIFVIQFRFCKISNNDQWNPILRKSRSFSFFYALSILFIQLPRFFRVHSLHLTYYYISDYLYICILRMFYKFFENILGKVIPAILQGVPKVRREKKLEYFRCFLTKLNGCFFV